MSDFYVKLNYLARTTGNGEHFDCDTRSGTITAWRDARPQPTPEEVAAVDLQTALDFEANRRVDLEVDNHPDPVIRGIIAESPGLAVALKARLRSERGLS